MSKSLALLGVLLPFVMFSGVGYANSGTAFVIEGKKYSIDEIVKENQGEFYDLEKRKFTIVESIAKDKFLDNYWTKTAKEQKKSVDVVKKEYFEKNIKLDEKEITSTLERFKDHPQLSKLSKDEQRNQVKDFLKEREKQALIQGIIDAGLKKGTFAISYPRPEEPVYSLTVTKADHVRYNSGPEFSKPSGCKEDECAITVVEYSEFQCPYCAKITPDTKKIMKDYKGKIRWVMRDFPLSFHNRAKPAAVAAHCAGKQDKYWQMYDILFANQRALEDDDLKKYAKEIKLDTKKWQTCVDGDDEVKELIQANFESGAKYGVSGTPAFFINGRRLSGALPYEEFKRVIDEELAKNRSH